MTYALDSNIVSYLLKDNDVVYSHYISALENDSPCVIPLIVYYEVRRGLKSSGATVQMQLFDSLCSDLGVCDLTAKDIDTAADIYADRKRRGIMIDDADLLIAAQAITRGYTLVTHNVRHFENIDGLKFVDWVE